jgi:ABC-type multidrug transport system fused ATPase/permease subunit
VARPREHRDLISRLTQDVELVRFVVGPALLHGGIAVLTVPYGLWLMSRLSGSLALMTVACFGLLLASMLLLMPRLEKLSKGTQEAIGAISQKAHEAFAGIRVVTRVRARRRRGRAHARARLDLPREQPPARPACAACWTCSCRCSATSSCSARS